MNARLALPSLALALVAATACSPAAPSGPTWYRDVEPMVQVNCNGCHGSGGIGGVVFDETSVGTLAGLMAKKTQAGVMPPWPPGPASKPLAGARVLAADQIDTIGKWARAGAPLGDRADHQERAPRVTFSPGRPPDAQAMMGDAAAYVPPPASSNVTDEVRCFVVDLANADNVWVTAVNWVPGQPGAIHHLGGLAVDANGAKVARSFYNADGRPGYECAGSFGPGVTAVAGFSASGAGRDTGTELPAGTGIFVPAGSSVILSVHYIVANLTAADKSGVQLWFANGPDKAQLRPTVQFQFSGPSELPCPTGVNTTDPNDRCSREYGIHQVLSESPDKTRAINDYLLKHCGTTLNAYYANLTFNQMDQSHFYIPTGCDEPLPYDGVIQVVHAHMHTRGASASIQYQKDDQSWDTLLDIPKYQWTWEGAYLLQQGVPIKAGQKLRLTCKYDNGTDIQWSAATHQPGHDGPATPPLEAPHYVVAGPERGDDMCAAFLTVERTSFQDAQWADACHEAQAIYNDQCKDSGINLTAGACSGTAERYAVALLETPAARVKPLWCGPKGPGAAVGAGCDQAMQCALACGAQTGFSGGLSQACADACKTNVNRYGATAGQPPASGSPAGDYRFDYLRQCADAACAAATTWQEYLSCFEAACPDDAAACFGK